MDKTKILKVSEETHTKIKDYAKRNYMKMNLLLEKWVDEKIKEENGKK